MATATTKGLKYLIHDTARLPYPTNTDKQPSMIMHNIITNGTDDVKKITSKVYLLQKTSCRSSAFSHANSGLQKGLKWFYYIVTPDGKSARLTILISPFHPVCPYRSQISPFMLKKDPRRPTPCSGLGELAKYF